MATVNTTVEVDLDFFDNMMSDCDTGEVATAFVQFIQAITNSYKKDEILDEIVDAITPENEDEREFIKTLARKLS
jgi:hypothetical protein